MKTKRTYFLVEGAGTFPFDMLRYDDCFPVSESKDSPKLDTSHDENHERRRVMLASDSPAAPTKRRWESFLWRVVAVADAPYNLEEQRNV